MWLSVLGVIPWTKELLVGFPVRVHTWVVGSVPGQGACEKEPIDVSLSLMDVSLPLFLLPFPSL